MKITIEATGDLPDLSDDGTNVWRGFTEGGVPVIVVVASIGCLPEHMSALENEVAADGVEWVYRDREAPLHGFTDASQAPVAANASIGNARGH